MSSGTNTHVGLRTFHTNDKVFKGHTEKNDLLNLQKICPFCEYPVRKIYRIFTKRTAHLKCIRHPRQYLEQFPLHINLPAYTLNAEIIHSEKIS